MTESTVLSATAGARSLSVKERAPEVVRPEVTTADVLHRAADLLEEFGWLQSELGSKESGGFCALGALKQAGFDLGLPGEHPLTGGGVGTAAFWAFQSLGGIHWNNAHGRTKSEVVSALRDTADCQQSAPKDDVSP